MRLPETLPSNRRLIDQALAGKQEVLGLGDGTNLAVAPILSEGLGGEDALLGVLYVRV